MISSVKSSDEAEAPATIWMPNINIKTYAVFIIVVIYISYEGPSLFIVGSQISNTADK